MNEYTGPAKTLYDFGKTMANLQEGFFNNILAICPTETDFENLLEPLR